MSKLQLQRIISIWGIVVFLTATAYSQVNTATLTGQVTDPTHAVIPGVHVRIVNEDTGFTKEAISDSRGEYTFSFLPRGPYTIAAEANGFIRLEQKGVKLVAGQVLRLDLKLRLGKTTQTVTVSGAAPLINLATSNQLETISNIEVQQLPQPKLDWSTLTNLGTGITLAAYGGSIPAQAGNTTVIMNGITGDAMSFTLDGTNASGTARGTSIGDYTHPNVINTVAYDAVQEISVNKGITPASVGGTLSGNVNLISKSGTNQFHGDAYEINSVAAYDARNQFLPTKAGFTFNQFGGSLGGPIKKDKLFFFGSYEGVRNSGFQVINTILPTPYLKSISPAIYAPLFDEYPSLSQPTNDPTALTVQYIAPGAAIQNDLNTTDRADYYISPSNQLNVRYIYAKPYKLNPSAAAANPQVWLDHHHMINANFVHSSGTWTSSSRFAYNSDFYARNQLGLDKDYEGVDISGIVGFPAAEDGGYTGYSWTAMEDIEKVHGRNTIQFGGIIQRQSTNSVDLNTASFGYSTLADFLNNTPSSLEITYDVPHDFPVYFYQLGGYVQDDIKATPNLTLNLGLRYDVFTIAHQKDGNIYNRGVDPTRPYLGQGFGDYLPPSSTYNPDHNNFQPRVGFAWAVGASRKTVIRGGAGVFVGPTDWFSGTILEVLPSGTIPFRSTFDQSQLLAGNVNYPVPRSEFLAALAAMQNAGVVAPFGKLPSSTTVSQNNPNPYTTQWMIQVEHELGWGTALSVGYVGNRGLKLIMDERMNLPNRITGIAPDPTFTTFTLVSPIDSSTYNSLQMNVRKRFEHGLTFQASYTYAANTTYCNGGVAGGCFPQDNSNIRADLGPTPWDIRNSFNASYVYQLRLPDWTRWHGRVSNFLIGGWQLSGILIAQSGLPLSIGNPGSIYPADRADAVSGVSPYLSNYQSTLDYLNPAAFAEVPIVPASGASERPGTSKRDGYFYPGMWNLDSMMAKYFPITERMRLQIHVDMFNTFNHTNLSGLSSSLNAINFGQLTSATPRSIQIGARLEF